MLLTCLAAVLPTAAQQPGTVDSCPEVWIELEQLPDMKITQVYSEVGFANENTFFRAFKSHTGLTPTEWKSRG